MAVVTPAQQQLSPDGCQHYCQSHARNGTRWKLPAESARNTNDSRRKCKQKPGGHHDDTFQVEMWPQVHWLTLRAKYTRVLESGVRWRSVFDWRTVSPSSGSSSSGRLRDPEDEKSMDPSLNFTNSAVPFQHYLKQRTANAQFQVILTFRIITKNQYLKWKLLLNKYKNFFPTKVLNRNVNEFKEMTTERMKFYFLLRRIPAALRRCYRQTDSVKC
jgi:hypothetical protein